MREGFYPRVMRMAEHMTPSTGQMRLMAVYCPGEEDTAPPELDRSCTWEQSEQAEAGLGQGGGFEVTRG